MAPRAAVLTLALFAAIPAMAEEATPPEIPAAWTMHQIDLTYMGFTTRYTCGGLKSKILAAHLSGARMVILPKKNEKDLRDIPEEIRKQVRIVMVESMDQVLDAALRRRPRPLDAKAGPSGPGRRGEGTHHPVQRPPFQPDQPAVVV